MDDRLVSVIMPACNSELFIGAAIESVRKQSYQSWELLIADDCSTDRTASIVQRFCELDSRISLIIREARGGPARARNSGIEIASGRWIAFLDSDDVWKPDKLQRTLDYAELNGFALTYTAYSRRSKKNVELMTVPSRVTYRSLLKSNSVATSTAVVDRSLVENFRMNENFQCDDYVAWLEILKAGHEAGGLNSPLTEYFKREGSHSSNKLKTANRVLRIFRDQQRLSLPKTIWYFANYAFRGLLKHSEFFRTISFQK